MNAAEEVRNELILLLKRNIMEAEMQIKNIQLSPAKINRWIVAFDYGVSIILINGDAEAHSRLAAAEYTKYEADRICQTVTNGRDEHPQRMLPIDWYSLRLKNDKASLEFLNSQAV